MSDERADWMRRTQRIAVQDRILEVAGELFAAKGPDASMSELAAAVGCSRATLYRYFDGRRRLQTAYVERVARRIGAAVDVRLTEVTVPEARLVDSILTALEQVRAEPALRAWFVPGGSGTASELALSSKLIEAMAAAFLGGVDQGVDRAAAQWVVRVIVSLLAVPGGTIDDERRLIERFVVPGVLGDPDRGGRT